MELKTTNNTMEEVDDIEFSDSESISGSDESVASQESDYDPGLGTNFKNVHQVITEERRKLFISLINDQGYSIAKVILHL